MTQEEEGGSGIGRADHGAKKKVVREGDATIPAVSTTPDASGVSRPPASTITASAITPKLGGLEVVVFDAAQPVLAKQHAQDQEE